jgi:hypothetical protein
MNQKFRWSIDRLPQTDVIMVAFPVIVVAPLVSVEAIE